MSTALSMAVGANVHLLKNGSSNSNLEFSVTWKYRMLSMHRDAFDGLRKTFLSSVPAYSVICRCSYSQIENKAWLPVQSLNQHYRKLAYISLHVEIPSALHCHTYAEKSLEHLLVLKMVLAALAFFYTP